VKGDFDNLQKIGVKKKKKKELALDFH